jgi:hypothetical protein
MIRSLAHVALQEKPGCLSRPSVLRKRQTRDIGGDPAEAPDACAGLASGGTLSP